MLLAVLRGCNGMGGLWLQQRSLGYVDNSSPEAINALQLMGTVISSCMVAILTFMVCLGFSALVYRAALGSQKEIRIFNLGTVPSELKVFNALVDIATYMTEEGKGKEEKFMKDLKALSVYDLSAVTRALDILADDLEMAVSHSMRSTSSSRRIAASKRTSRGTRDSTQSGQSRDSGIVDTSTNAAGTKCASQVGIAFMFSSWPLRTLLVRRRRMRSSS